MLNRALLALGVVALLAGCATAGRQISSPPMRAFELSLAQDGSKLVSAWNGGPADVEAIYFRWLDARGAPAGAAYKVTDGPSEAYEADIQLLRGDPLIAWYEKDAAGKLTAWVALFSPQGELLWRRGLSGMGGAARNPVVRVQGDVINVAWMEQGAPGQIDVWVARMRRDGSPLTPPYRAGAAGATTWNLNATTGADGVFYVVYDAKLSTKEKELHLLRIEDRQATHVQLSADDGYESVYPDMAISSSGVVAMTWFDKRDGNNEIYLQTGTMEVIRDGAAKAVRLTNTKADSIGAYLAWNGERLAVAWCDSEPGQQELFAQTFDSSGRSVAPAMRLTHTALQSSIPAIRPWRDGFVIAWNEYRRAEDARHAGIAQSDAMVRFLR